MLKKFFIVVLSVISIAVLYMCVGCQSNDERYVDLGLPSGTLWKATNEDKHYNYNDAVKEFGDNLPSKAQWEELRDMCTWTWIEKHPNKYKVKGPNGKSIEFPVSGLYYCDGNIGAVCSDGNYWSSTPTDELDHDLAWNLHFDYDGVDIYQSFCCYGYAVRLVK